MSTINCPHCGKSFPAPARADTATHEIRSYCDMAVASGEYPSRSEVQKALAHLNGATVSTQYQKWLKTQKPEVRAAIALARQGLDPKMAFAAK